ncbi:MAG TPA: hypothetical protein VNV43_15150 [Candidatus Acidoferrales bacterium]|nr:hypothetical protein [Candidatus Acidoferrales bacterium]
MRTRKPLNRRFAIALAVTTMWIGSSVGFLLGFHSGDWYFIFLRGYDLNTIGQIGAFFLAWFAVQIPGAYLAGSAIAASDFRHPLRVTFWTMTCYHAVFSIIRAFHWLWRAFPDLDQSIPVLFYLISVLSLIGVSVFFYLVYAEV